MHPELNVKYVQYGGCKFCFFIGGEMFWFQHDNVNFDVFINTILLHYSTKVD